MRPSRNFHNPLSRLSLAGQPPLIVTAGVTVLAGMTSGLVLVLLGSLGALSPGAWRPALIAWAGGTALTATLSYTIGGSVWGPYSWLHHAIDMISKGDFNFPAEPTAQEARHLTRGLHRIAEELQRYRGLEIEALILEKSELEAVIHSMTEGLVIYDLGFKPVMANPALRQLAQSEGVADEAAAARFLDRWSHPDQLAVIEEATRQAPDRPRVDIVELERPKQFLKRFSSPLYNADERQIGHLVIYHDITPEIEADRLKSEFISNASHELRTPVTSLKVLVESLLDGAQEEPALRQSFLEDIHHELERLHALVNDLLDLAALEAKSGLKLQRIDAAQVIDEAVSTVQPQAAKRDIRLELAVPYAGLPLSVDRVRLRQILVNLLANAIKFTPNGGRVTLSALDRDDDARFQVSDTGIGIPAKDLPHIFDRFFRVTRGRSRLQGGSGLGLTIVKQAVDAHQGQISVESTEGHGTTISFTIPKGLAPDAEPRTGP
ncbi:MAG TPA: ATP-binding protein [Pantanalinema sp.]